MILTVSPRILKAPKSCARISPAFAGIESRFVPVAERQDPEVTNPEPFDGIAF